MTNVMTNEILSEEQLEGVAGGTATEFGEICEAMDSNVVLKKLLLVSSHIPGGNLASKEVVISTLKHELNIDADISIGFLGTGWGSNPNKYKEFNTGRPLSHAEVIERIKNFAK